MATNHQVNGSGLIHLTLLNGTGYVFNADDYMRLRKEHRIVGALVGTCNTRGWSANESTLPAELTLCETRLLLEEGLAVLVSKEDALLRAPSESELAEYKVNFEARLQAQAEELKTEKLRESERNMDRILAGKRRKLLKAGVPESDITLDPSAVLKEISDSFVFERKNALLEVPCAHPQTGAFPTVQLPPDNSLKYHVFRDFWKRGKYVTAGDAFGADLLIYPGDPLLFHASHIVILLENPSVAPLELIAKVRLSVMVNKICLIAYFVKRANETDEAESAEIHYQTVIWEGNRDRERS